MPTATQLGGAEQMLLSLLEANRQGPCLDYHLAFLEDGPMVAQVAALGCPVERFSAGQLRQAHRYVATVRGLRGWLRKLEPDLVMSWMGKAHLYAGPAARRAGLPAVWWQHGIPDRHWMNRLATRIPAKAVLCCSKAVQQAQAQLSPSRRSYVVYPAVDLCRFSLEGVPSPGAARTHLDLPLEGPIVGIVSRLQRQKGVHLFLKAAETVAKVHPDVFFVVVGGRYPLDPDYPEQLAQQARAAGLPPRVIFAGQQTDIPLWMQAMDVVVMASVQPEGFGMVAVEAMALGKIVIASRSGGTVEIIEEGIDGLLVEPGDAAAFATAIQRALSPDLNLESMRGAARQKARRFSPGQLADDMARILQEICV